MEGADAAAADAPGAVAPVEEAAPSPDAGAAPDDTAAPETVSDAAPSAAAEDAEDAEEDSEEVAELRAALAAAAADAALSHSRDTAAQMEARCVCMRLLACARVHASPRGATHAWAHAGRALPLLRARVRAWRLLGAATRGSASKAGRGQRVRFVRLLTLSRARALSPPPQLREQSAQRDALAEHVAAAADVAGGEATRAELTAQARGGARGVGRDALLERAPSSP